MHSSDFSTKMLSEHKNTIHYTYYYTVHIYVTHYTSNVSSTNYHDALKYPKRNIRRLKIQNYKKQWIGHKIHIIMQSIIIYLQLTIMYSYFVIIHHL